MLQLTVSGSHKQFFFFFEIYTSSCYHNGHSLSLQVTQAVAIITDILYRFISIHAHDDMESRISILILLNPWHVSSSNRYLRIMLAGKTPATVVDYYTAWKGPAAWGWVASWCCYHSQFSSEIFKMPATAPLYHNLAAEERLAAILLQSSRQHVL